MTAETLQLEEEYHKLLQSNNRPLVVVLTGAGISAESGIPTFRDANGLWEGHDVHEVASLEGWAKNPELVLQFYNLRREAAWKALPNAGHIALVELEASCLVIVITQNVDSLHERAGSSHVLHLHGELRKARSTGNPDLIYDIEDRPIYMGDCCELGHQLRPHIVWFGEEVPLISLAAQICKKADFMLIIGTSMQVYPAAGLLNFVPKEAEKYIIDKKLPLINLDSRMNLLEYPATIGVPRAVAAIKKMLNNRLKPDINSS
jgi:NAD-dependent deacetylase